MFKKIHYIITLYVANISAKRLLVNKVNKTFVRHINFFHVPTCLACLSWFRAGPYHASATIIAQMIILFKGRRKRKYQMTFAKRVFMFFNVFLHFSATNYWSGFLHMTCTTPEATNANRVSMSVFISLFLSFFYSSLFHYLFKGFLLPCFFNETPYFSFSSCTIFYSSREHVT